jgi:multiple sugar transport system substrate-binding protein
MRFTKVVAAVVGLMLLVASHAALAQTELTWYYCCAQQERADMFNSWAREFEKLNPGVKINALYPATDGSTYYDKVSISIASDMAPDIFWAGIQLWNYADLLMPLDELYKTDQMIAEIAPIMVQNLRWQGNIIAIPFGVNVHAFYYNKDMFAEAGVKMPKDWTWTEAIEMGKKMTFDKNGDGKLDRWGLAFTETAHTITYGSNFYSEDLRKVLINNPVTTAGMQFTSDLITGKFNAYYTGTGTTSRQEFKNGVIGAHSYGAFQLKEMTRDLKFDWDVAMYPKLEVDNKYYRTAFFSLEAWCAYNGTKHPELVKKFLKFIMQKEKMIQFGNLGAVVPTQPSVAVRSFLNIPKPANIRAFSDTLSYHRRTERDHPAQLNIDSMPTFRSIMNGSMPAATGVPELAQQMQNLIDEFWTKYDK